jgi:hypothetical protein
VFLTITLRSRGCNESNISMDISIVTVLKDIKALYYFLKKRMYC